MAEDMVHFLKRKEIYFYLFISLAIMEILIGFLAKTFPNMNSENLGTPLERQYECTLSR